MIDEFLTRVALARTDETTMSLVIMVTTEVLVLSAMLAGLVRKRHFIASLARTRS